jgi:hypothetical protein
VPSVVLVVFAPLAVYGARNLFAPATTARWQRNATARRADGSIGRSVGVGMQTLVGTDDTRLGRVRLIGLCKIAVALAAVAIAIAWQ